jgi:hypothetical protein
MATFRHDTAPTQYVEADGIRFAYRRFGNPERSPLVFFQHFMGTSTTTIRPSATGLPPTAKSSCSTTPAWPHPPG